MNARWLRRTCVLAGLFSSAFAAIACLEPRPRLLWNASPSAPVGLYLVDDFVLPRRGDLVVLTPKAAIARLIEERGYLPTGVPLLKHIAALPGQSVCRRGAKVTVDGKTMSVARPHDRMGRTMPVWQGCRCVGADELFLLNPAADSLDGRYFGPVASSSIVGIARPLLTRSRPGAPLRWLPEPELNHATTRNEEHLP